MDWSRPLPLSLRNIDRVPPDLCGVYWIHTRRICIYIGIAVDQSIRKRLRQHYYNCHNAALKSWINSSAALFFKYSEVNDKFFIPVIEDQLIEKYRPETNIRGKPERRTAHEYVASSI